MSPAGLCCCVVRRRCERPRAVGGYGDAVRTPDAREPRAPAIAIWTLTGAFVGLAGGVVMSNVPLLVVIFAVIGLLYGLYTTRPKRTPDED